MKKVKCLMAIAAFALYVSACSGSRNSTSSGTNGMQNSGTTTSPGMTNSSGATNSSGITNSSGTTNPSSSGSRTDSSQLR